MLEGLKEAAGERGGVFSCARADVPARSVTLVAQGWVLESVGTVVLHPSNMRAVGGESPRFGPRHSKAAGGH